jgi:Cys-tRNA(Pro)/Cys-tRNA(Cys) deacylase
METRASKYLKKKQVPFKTVEYKHEEKGAEFAARAIGFALEKTVKTLVADLGPNGYVLALMPGDKHLSMKKLAKACCAKKASMANTETAQRLTGYWVGGISPFGTRQKLAVVMEKSLFQYDEVAINAGQRGVMLIMNPKDILRASDGIGADLIY